MKKLKVDDLQVESFETTQLPASPRGTVRAHSAGVDEMGTCFAVNTLCGFQCGYTEGGTDCGGGGTGICTQYAYTCGEEGTCAPGATMCGTCYGEATCDLQYGCGGTTDGPQIC
jgi:hypothetical protein